MIGHSLQEKLKIISHSEINRGYFHMRLGNSRIASLARPGQFVMVETDKADGPLLRRPLGIHSVTKKNIEILYEVKGEGTGLLSGKSPGECLDIIGPLGNGFDPDLGVEDLAPVLVAGGMGVAPLLFLAKRLAHRKPRVLLGARGKNKILCAEEFKDLGCAVKIATDDGSSGFKGRVTDLLKQLLSNNDFQTSAVYACGPAPMLKRIAELSKVYRFPAQVSLEAHMSCGFGACLGCVVDTLKGYKRVCKDGPVFMADEVIY